MTSEKAFLAALVRAMRGARVARKTILATLRVTKATWNEWSMDEQAARQAAQVDILPGWQLTVCYMSTWLTADGSECTGDHWRVTYRGQGRYERVDGEFSVNVNGGTYWAVTTSSFKCE